MIKNNVKMLIFASLMVAMILPFSAMEFAEADKPNLTKRIQKPVESEFQKETKAKVKVLFLERMALISEGKDLKEKYQKNGLQSLDDSEKTLLKKISERLKVISGKFDKINIESRKLYSATNEEKHNLHVGQQLVINSGIPYEVIGPDLKAGALVITFVNQEIADQYIPQLDEMLKVPYYIEIGDAVLWNCSEINSNCDPLMGGIEIGTESHGVVGGVDICSISVPMVRNVFWWIEEGFVTAAHCFAEINNPLDNGHGNYVEQPFDSDSKVGHVTAIQYSGECDCAFVATNGERDLFFGNWWGTDNSNQLLSKSDPLVGDYVVMIGDASGIQVGQVMNTNKTGNGIANMHTINHAMTYGDSGGIVIDLTTYNNYHGLIHGGIDDVETYIVPWSHIDNALDLQ